MTTQEIGTPEVMTAIARIKPIIEANADDGERDRKLPDATMRAMLDAGLFKLAVPKEYGGDELDLPAYMAAIEEVSRIDGAAGWNFMIMASGAFIAAYTPGGMELYAGTPNRPMGGSVQPRGRAVPVDGGYRLSGRWPLVSGCHHSNGLGFVALVFDGETPRMGPHGAPDFKNMMLKSGEYEILDTWHSIGLRGTGSTDVVVQDVFVPENMTFSVFTDPPRVSGPLYKAGLLPLFSMVIATVPLGIARHAIDSFVELARTKTPTLSTDGLATRPTIHAEVAKAEALLQSSRAFMFHVAGEIMASVNAGQGMPDALEASRRLACMSTAVNCVEAVERVYALAGSTPLYTGHPIERCLRDIHAASQHLVVSPVWWEKTGQYYFDLGLGMP